MRAVSIAVLVLVMALAGAAAIAQSCPNTTQCPQMTEPSSIPTAPVCPGTVTESSCGAAVGAGPEVAAPAATAPVCPGMEQPSSATVPVCPGVVEQPSSASVPTCPSEMTAPPAPVVTPSAPAVLGAGPAADLANLCGADFDKAYIRTMYNLHTEIAALATQGIEQTSDKNLKDLSGKIRYEQTVQNEKLALWARDMGLGKIPVDYSRVQAIVDSLTTYYGGADFDAQYAAQMSALLGQQRDVAQLGSTKLTNPEMRDQAKIGVDTTTNEINALQRWIVEKSPTVPATAPVPTTVPAAPGAGPAPVYVAPTPGYTAPPFPY